MSKIYFQGTYGAYSHLAALSVDPNAEIIPCKTFDECFINASKDANAKIIIPESNRITGNIGIEYLIFEYRLNIYSEYFQKIEHIRADTAGSAEMVSKVKDKTKAAIASSLSAKTYNLEVIQKNIENEKGNLTRFLIMGKNVAQPEFGKKKYITTFLFKLKSKPAALYQSLAGFAVHQVNLTKLQSYPEKNTFDSYFFLCDLDGHIEDKKVQKSLEELGLSLIHI